MVYAPPCSVCRRSYNTRTGCLFDSCRVTTATSRNKLGNTKRRRRDGAFWLTAGEPRLTNTHTHTHSLHTSSHQRGIQNTTGIAPTPCSLLSKYNCSLLVNLWKQAGAIETERLQDTSCFTPHFLSPLHGPVWLNAYLPLVALCVQTSRVSSLTWTRVLRSFLQKHRGQCLSERLSWRRRDRRPV